MRILLSCLQSEKDHPLPAYDFWRPYFLRGCEESGIECVEIPGVDWAEGLLYPRGDALGAWQARTWQAVLQFVRREQAKSPVHLFLTYLYPKQVEPAAIEELQRIGIPCVNFFCDNVREFRKVPDEYRPFALHWVPEYEALPMYDRAGLPHIHAPMPCWVPPQLRSVPLRETEPPTFIGSADVVRRDLIGRAVQAGADLVVRGAGWTPGDHDRRAARSVRKLTTIVGNQVSLARQHGLSALCHKVADRLLPLQPPPLRPEALKPFVSRDEYVRITRESVVAVGINRVPTAQASNRKPLAYSRLRDIEAPMLGACYLTEWTAGLEKLYEPGREVECYRTAEEMSFKIGELKRDPVRRRRMRESAQRRALSDHSITRTLMRICSRLAVGR